MRKDYIRGDSSVSLKILKPVVRINVDYGRSSRFCFPDAVQIVKQGLGLEISVTISKFYFSRRIVGFGIILNLRHGCIRDFYFIKVYSAEPAVGICN